MWLVRPGDAERYVALGREACFSPVFLFVGAGVKGGGILGSRGQVVVN